LERKLVYSESKLPKDIVFSDVIENSRRDGSVWETNSENYTENQIRKVSNIKGTIPTLPGFLQDSWMELDLELGPSKQRLRISLRTNSNTTFNIILPYDSVQLH
jgi:hypothetical protein